MRPPHPQPPRPSIIRSRPAGYSNARCLRGGLSGRRHISQFAASRSVRLAVGMRPTLRVLQNFYRLFPRKGETFTSRDRFDQDTIPAKPLARKNPFPGARIAKQPKENPTGFFPSPKELWCKMHHLLQFFAPFPFALEFPFLPCRSSENWHENCFSVL